MSLTVSTARPQGNVNVVSSSGMGVQQAGGGSAQRLQATYNPVRTFNPQQTAPSTVLQNTLNPYLITNSNFRQSQAARQQAARQAGEKQAAEIIAAIEAMNPLPVLPAFNSSAARTSARQQAAKQVNPVYQGLLNEYLQGKNLRIEGQRGQTEFNKQELARALAGVLEDSETRRGRTAEDTEMQLGDIDATESSWETQEGRNFDRARTALMGDVADAGLTESGIGQGTIQDATTDRNLQTADQRRAFEREREDVEIFQTRTLEDLDTLDTRETERTEAGKKEQDRLLEQFIMEETQAERQFRIENEQARLNEIRNISGDIYAQTVANKAAQLAQGGRAQRDIDYFLRVFG